jgi:hypothetical protein
VLASLLSALALANVAIALDTPDRIYLLSASLQRIGIDMIIILTFSVSETSILNKPVNKLISLCRSMEEKP